MINVYPVKIEAVDVETKELMFTMETFDGFGATVAIKTTIGPSNIEDLIAAMRGAVAMLELE